MVASVLGRGHALELTPSDTFCLCCLPSACVFVVLSVCFTLSAHTPDNSFLGFVVDADVQEGQQLDKLNQAVVYVPKESLSMITLCGILVKTSPLPWYCMVGIVGIFSMQKQNGLLLLV